jgi:hypothetical protein
MKANWIKHGLTAGVLSAGLAVGCNHADMRSASAMPSRTDVASRMPGYGTGAAKPAVNSAGGSSGTEVAGNKPAALDAASPSLAIPGKVEMPKQEPVFPTASSSESSAAKDPLVQPASATEPSRPAAAGTTPPATTAPKAPWDTSVLATPAPPDSASGPAASPPEAPAAPANPNYGHADDYSWVMGQLQYSRTHGSWRLRYAPLDQADQYGGSVTLADDVQNAGYKDGQFVRIDGRLINASSRSIAPSYEVDSIRAVEAK